jgi:predicted Ser/Thr protein kinase
MGTPVPDDTVGQAPATQNEGEKPLTLGVGDHVGRYELLGVVGEGGMSYVYLAHDPELDRDVALKLMRVRVGKEGARRLQREAQALAKLSHPNVVPVYDAGMVGDQAFVAMEYVKGITLRRWLRAQKRTWREIVAAMVDAGRGLSAAHQRGLVHRDFKPDNVLIGDDGRVRVLDFGLARLAGVLDGTIAPSLPSGDAPPSSSSGAPPSSSGSRASVATPELLVTRADQLVGTPGYMAPEQLRRDPVDERTDIFAFGVTLYEGLFGKRPFGTQGAPKIPSDANTVAGAGAEAAPGPAPIPRKTDVPRHLQRIVLRALAEDPRNRWRSVDEMLAALQKDPTRVWKRAGMVAAGVATVCAVAVVSARTQPRAAPSCNGGETRKGALWGAGAHDDVRAAFARTGLPYAGEASSTVISALDDYATRLARAADDACAATRLRGEQTEDALDLRTACYEVRWRETGALVDVLRRADADVVQEATHAAKNLSPLEACADVPALRSSTPRPRDPAVAAKVDAIEQRLAVVKADHAVGKANEAADIAGALSAEARATGFGPLEAEVDLWRGRAYADLSDDRSIEAFQSAFDEALSSRTDAVLRVAATRLAQELIYAHRPAEFETWASVAQAAIDRGPPDPVLQSFLDHERCVALEPTGRIQDRLACLEAHARKVEPTRPLDEWERTTLGLAAVDAGQFARGQEYLHRGTEYSSRVLGPTHPRTLEMRMYEMKGLVDSGDLDAAVTFGRATLTQMEQVAKDNTALMGRMHVYLARALALDHRWAEARAEIARAQGDEVDAADIQDVQGQIDIGTGHPERAIAHLRESVEQSKEGVPPDHPNVLGAETALASALLDAKQAAEARRILDATLAASAKTQLAPVGLADLRFAAARARWATGGSKTDAIRLAQQALDTYATGVPPTKGMLRQRAEIEAWLDQPR